MAGSSLTLETPLEITRKKIEALIAAKDLREAVVQCEELELQVRVTLLRRGQATIFASPPASQRL